MYKYKYKYIYKVKTFNGVDCIAKSYYLVHPLQNEVEIAVILDELYRIDPRNHIIFDDINLKEDFMVVSPSPLPYTVKELNMCGNINDASFPVLLTKRHLEHAEVLLNSN